MRDHGGGVAEVHYDTDPLATGTHGGASGTLTLQDNGQDFRVAGVSVGLAIENETDGSVGLVTAVTERTVTCTLAGGVANAWANGDTYKIYKTAAKGTKISTIYTDRIHGQKVTRQDELYKGHLADDVDLDIDNRNVFGPGQPERH